MAMMKTSKAPENASSLGTKKRARPELVHDEEKERLRDKNRTNSKRFRERKKNFMDGLFEEKYRLGKINNELRLDNEKLRVLLEEAITENKNLRRKTTMGLCQSKPVLSQIPAALLNVASNSPRISLDISSRIQFANQRMGQLAIPGARPKLDILASPRVSSASDTGSSLNNLMQLFEAKKRQQLLGDLALRGLEESIKAKITGVGATGAIHPNDLLHQSLLRELRM